MTPLEERRALGIAARTILGAALIGPLILIAIAAFLWGLVEWVWGAWR